MITSHLDRPAEDRPTVTRRPQALCFVIFMHDFALTGVVANAVRLANALAARGHETNLLVCSEAERASMKIERTADDICLAFLLERRIAELATADDDKPSIWDGEIVGVISKGWFVRFGDERFEGMLPVRRVDGWWEPDEHQSQLVDANSGRAIRHGDPVRVAVARVEPVRGRVDLDLAV